MRSMLKTPAGSPCHGMPHEDCTTPPRLLIVVNFTPVPRRDYEVAVPVAGFYSELLYTEAAFSADQTSATPGVSTACQVLAADKLRTSLKLPPLEMVLKPVTGISITN